MKLGWIQNLHLMFVGIALVTIISSLIFSAGYLLQQWQIKHKKNLPIVGRLPSLEALDHYVIRSLISGFFSVSILLISGILLAHLVWKKDWTQDEKFIVALSTWFWFLLTLTIRFKFGIRGEKFFYSILFGFFLLVASCTLAWMV